MIRFIPAIAFALISHVAFAGPRRARYRRSAGLGDGPGAFRAAMPAGVPLLGVACRFAHAQAPSCV